MQAERFGRGKLHLTLWQVDNNRELTPNFGDERGQAAAI
jgi:hypothetical protein